MALFRLNWEESKGGFTMCPILPNKILQDLSSKIPPPKKVPWHRRSAALRRGSTGHFCQKNAFFGQKKAFFQKVHFIQICSVTQNTVFQCFKNNFFLSQEKLIFFTILNLYRYMESTNVMKWNINWAPTPLRLHQKRYPSWTCPPGIHKGGKLSSSVPCHTGCWCWSPHHLRPHQSQADPAPGSRKESL